MTSKKEAIDVIRSRVRELRKKVHELVKIVDNPELSRKVHRLDEEADRIATDIDLHFKKKT